MSLPLWQPGQQTSADRLNNATMIGAILFIAYRDTNQSISSTATPTASNALSYSTISLDLLGAWNAGTPTRWTVPTGMTGYYEMAGAVGYNASASGTIRDACWFVNGALVTASRNRWAPGSIANTALTVLAPTMTLPLAAGDYVELVAVQDTGGALNSATGSLSSFANVTYRGPQ